jgi:hypothetical protein
MSAHGQTMTWGMHVGNSIQNVRGHWLQRLRQWLSGWPKGHNQSPTMTSYKGWDAQHERFQPLRVESTLDHAAGRGGQSWLITMHSATV